VSQKVRLVSAARHKYAGRFLRVGDEFDAESLQDAEDLVALNFARVVPVVMTTPEAAAVVTTPRRSYRRRDMKAEGSS
jgi:hypothetical protein